MKFFVVIKQRSDLRFGEQELLSDSKDAEFQEFSKDMERVFRKEATGISAACNGGNGDLSASPPL